MNTHYQRPYAEYYDATPLIESMLPYIKSPIARYVIRKNCMNLNNTIREVYDHGFTTDSMMRLHCQMELFFQHAQLLWRRVIRQKQYGQSAYFKYRNIIYRFDHNLYYGAAWKHCLQDAYYCDKGYMFDVQFDGNYPRNYRMGWAESFMVSIDVYKLNTVIVPSPRKIRYKRGPKLRPLLAKPKRHSNGGYHKPVEFSVIPSTNDGTIDSAIKWFTDQLPDEEFGYRFRVRRTLASAVEVSNRCLEIVQKKDGSYRKLKAAETADFGLLAIYTQILSRDFDTYINTIPKKVWKKHKKDVAIAINIILSAIDYNVYEIFFGDYKVDKVGNCIRGTRDRLFEIVDNPYQRNLIKPRYTIWDSEADVWKFDAVELPDYKD